MATRGWESATLATLRGKLRVAKAAPSKYHNQPITIDGERFDSKREAAYWQGLKARERNGEIQHLRRQVCFPIWGIDRFNERQYVCEYVADFVYEEHGVRHVVDVKGVRTPIYRIKKKFLAVQGIVVEEC
jgi:hypothetical protein